MTEQSFHHSERRFLLPIQFRALMEPYLIGARHYATLTQYLDTAEGTWSHLTMSEEHPKIRLRTYNGADTFLEKKLHANGETTKERVPWNPSSAVPGLLCVGMTQYIRQELSLDDVRVTVDRDLCGMANDEQVRTIVSQDGSLTAQLKSLLPNHWIIEVKGKLPKRLAFLKTFEEKRFSKWKLLTGKFVVRSYEETAKRLTRIRAEKAEEIPA